MLGGLRLLTEEEIEQVAGVYDGCGGMWPPEYYTTTIYVVYTPPPSFGSSWTSSMSMAYYMDNYYQDPYAQMSYAPPSGGGGGGGTSGPNYPSDFDHQQDNTVDNVAAQVANVLASMPNVATQEYGAVLWKDASGNVYSTSIVNGTSTGISQAQWQTVWSQIDFANGGEIVGMLHSHPTSNSNGQYLSSGDFNHLMSVADGSQGSGYDSTNFRMYVLYNNNVSEYYGFDQNSAYVTSGATIVPATWAVKSTDYGQ